MNPRKMNILAIIPARGGSKGLPRKNVRLLNGKPLLAYSIEQAHAAAPVTRTVVSTDDDEIAGVAREYGAEVIKRPPELATDTASSEAALQHVLDYLRETEGYEPDLVVFLQATSPVRTPGDIERAIGLLQDEDADSLVSVTPWHGLNWTRENGEAKSVTFDYRRRPRRQELPPAFRENGSIFVFKPWVIRKLGNRLGGKIALFEMGPWSRFEADTPEDFALCEWILKNKVYHD